MKSDAQNFIDRLTSAEQLLKDYPGESDNRTHESVAALPTAHFDFKLFEERTAFPEPWHQQKAPVRIIQHLSCTGGTVICKCLAGMPNAALLSEVNPASRLHPDQPHFAPTDLTYLALQSKFPLHEELSQKIFKAGIDVITKHVQQLGKYLVIREHSHSDFLVGETPNGFSTIKMLLQDRHPMLCVLTTRHPVDSYLSLITNGWVHFSPRIFDEYCKRYLLFIESNKGVPLFKYENFSADPQTEMKSICEALELPYNKDFLNIFDLNDISGDSGRSSDTITPRDRREFNDAFRTEAEESTNYIQLCERLDYESSI